MNALGWMLLFAFVSGAATGLAEYGVSLLHQMDRRRRSRRA